MRKSYAMLASAMLAVSTMLPTSGLKIPPRINQEISTPFKRYGASTGKRRSSRAEVRGW